MSRHGHCIFYALQLVQEEGIHSRDVPCLDQIRPLHNGLELRHPKPPQHLLLLPGDLLLCGLILCVGGLFFGLFLLNHFGSLGVSGCFGLGTLEHLLELFVVLASQDVLVFLCNFSDFLLRLLGQVLSDLLALSLVRLTLFFAPMLALLLFCFFGLQAGFVFLSELFAHSLLKIIMNRSPYVRKNKVNDYFQVKYFEEPKY